MKTLLFLLTLALVPFLADAEAAIRLSGPSSATVEQGESVSVTIQLRHRGKSQVTAFSIINLPAGVTATFTPTSCKPNCSTTLKLTAALDAIPDDYSLTIKAQNRGEEAFMSFILIVKKRSQPPPPPPPGEPWEDILANVVGFGQNTIGGAGGPLVHVTNLNNSGAGSLREAAEAVGPAWIVFDVSGTITLSSFIHMTNGNKTIDGRGQDITVENGGFIIGSFGSGNPPAVSNVIIHNIKVMRVDNSIRSIGIGQNASNVWIDHVTFQDAIDETLDIASTGIGPAPHSVTISWNRILDRTSATWSGFGIIISHDPTHTVDTDITVTLHHNHYDNGEVRHPFARFGRVHSFNNYYNGVVIGADAVTDVQFYSENEIFLYNGGSQPMVKHWQPDGTPAGDDGARNVKVLNPLLLNGATVQEWEPSTIFNPSAFYSYTPDPASTATRDAIVAGAGWQDVPLPQ